MKVVVCWLIRACWIITEGGLSTETAIVGRNCKYAELMSGYQHKSNVSLQAYSNNNQLRVSLLHSSEYQLMESKATMYALGCISVAMHPMGGLRH